MEIYLVLFVALILLGVWVAVLHGQIGALRSSVRERVSQDDHRHLRDRYWEVRRRLDLLLEHLGLEEDEQPATRRIVKRQK